MAGVFLLCGLLVFGVLPPPDRTSDSIKDFFVRPSTFLFSDAGWGLSFRYPSDWTRTYVAPGMVVFKDGEKTALVISSQKLKDERMNLGSLVTENKKEITESLGDNHLDYTIGAGEPFTLSGLPAMRFDLYTKGDPNKEVGEQAVTLHKGRAYFFSSVQTLDSVLESMKIK